MAIEKKQKTKLRKGLFAFGVVIFVLLTSMMCLYFFRFELWRINKNVRPILRPILLFDSSLRKVKKVDVISLLGAPDITEGRYCWFPRDLSNVTGDSRDLSNVTGDLRFEIGELNRACPMRRVKNGV